jgi:hypothetical protein
MFSESVPDYTSATGFFDNFSSRKLACKSTILKALSPHNIRAVEDCPDVWNSCADKPNE